MQIYRYIVKQIEVNRMTPVLYSGIFVSIICQETCINIFINSCMSPILLLVADIYTFITILYQAVIRSLDLQMISQTGIAGCKSTLMQSFTNSHFNKC